MLGWILGVAVAHAGCDAAALSKSLATATPNQSPAMFAELAGCDATKAKTDAAKVVPNWLGSDQSYKAAAWAVDVGAGDVVRGWMEKLQSDERATALSTLGSSCEKSAGIQSFFLDSEKALSTKFWSDGWYKGLAACRVSSIQSLLTGEVNKGSTSDRSRFSALLETYARNLGAAAIPTLAGLLEKQTDAEVANIIISAFADAAQVGSEAGTDAKTAAAAVQALTQAGPKIPVGSLDVARSTLVALGDEQAADGLAAVAYAANKQADGFHWGIVAVESATCKNGKTQRYLHVGEAINAGNAWADQVAGLSKDSIVNAWHLDMAEKCKGEGQVEVVPSGVPVANKAAFDAWVKTQLDGFDATAVDKQSRFDHEAIQF